MAVINCPSLLVRRARTGRPDASDNSKITPSRYSPRGSRTRPVRRLGRSGEGMGLLVTNIELTVGAEPNEERTGSSCRSCLPVVGTAGGGRGAGGGLGASRGKAEKARLGWEKIWEKRAMS